jgi:hypothetical protein
MKTNWELIKTAYVTSDKDMKEIADAFKVNFDVLRRHAAKERWTEQRKLFRVTTTKQATEKRSSEMATDIAQFDSDSLKLARAGYGLVAEDIKARKPAKDIAVALANFQKVGKLAFGEVGDADKDININVKYDDK